MEKIEVIHMPYQELRTLAEVAYGIKDFNIAETEEKSNDSYCLYTVERGPDTWTKENEQAKIESIRGGYVPLYRTNLFMNLLCEDGHLEPGRYLVEISW